MIISNTNDGSSREPYLRTDINMGGISTLPADSDGPRGDARAVHVALKAAGFMGVQGGAPALCRELGLGVATGGRVNQPGEIAELAAAWKEQGYACATVHVGWGMESDDEIDRLLESIIRASIAHELPVYIETHRATITQDQWRTVEMTKRFPGVRFNGDFSHWYTGQEMVYGDWAAKLDFLAPVFERVRFIHGRIGNPGCMQVGIRETADESYTAHFRELWTRSFVGFLRTARPGDYISFNPELLHPQIYYARTFPDARGEAVEECDRWTQALLYTRIAKECFEEARRRLAR